MLQAGTHDMEPFFPLTTSGSLADIAPQHAFTTRALRFRDETADADWAELSRRLDTPADRIVRVAQVHGRKVLVIDQTLSPWRAMEGHGVQADSIVCTDLDLAIAVRVADCVPILIADKSHRVVAAVHAGWRGVACRAVEAGVERLKSLARERLDLVAAIGPHISLASFEVSEEVANVLREASPEPNVVDWSRARPHVDLRRIVRAQLASLGLPEAAIDDVPGCTVLDETRFFSFRRDGKASGRLLSAIVPRAG